MENKVVGSLESTIAEMKAGDYTESDAAILITRDAETGILTFTPHGNIPEVEELFKEAARVRGYAKVE